MMYYVEGFRTVEGIMMPWYTRPCLEWLSSLDLHGKRVWEYGGGDSTLWYKENGCFCHGVDDSEQWAQSGGNQYETDKEKYLKAIEKVGYPFDLICIDGSFRDECAKYALDHLAPGGYVIIDNWKQATANLREWPKTEALIEEENLSITVYKEPTHQDWQTAVLTK